MNATGNNLAVEYGAALHDCLAGRGEAALRRAYEAGRRALADGLGVLEMVSAHEQAVREMLRQHEHSEERIVTLALGCLAESLSPFEMVLRGAQESNARLRESVFAVEKERRRYHTLFDFAPDAYLVTGFDGVIREANAAAAVLFHSSQHLLPGRSILEFVGHGDRESFQARLLELEGGGLQRLEDWQISIEPGPSPVAVTVAAERDSSDVTLRWLIRDVTERKRQEQERAHSLLDHAKAQAARRFEFLAEASSLLVSSFDAPASLSTVAQMAVPYLAEWCFVNIVEEDGSVRQVEVAHSDNCETAEQLRRHCLFQSKPIVTLAGITNGITSDWCDCVAESAEHAALLGKLCGQPAIIAPLLIRDRVMGALTFVGARHAGPYSASDLTLAEDLARRCALALENARLYREVIAERDRAEKASRAKDEFLAILSHELRNPLMPVIGWTRMLKNHSLIAQDPVLVEGVRSMERNAQTLGRLVGDCLDLARISEGKIQMERQPVDLNQIVLGSIEAVREMAAEKEIRIESHVAAGSIFLLGDATRLEQVIMNLLVNAVKYTERRGHVLISCSQFETEAEIQVIDTGVGIPPAFLDYIFEPFRRGSGSWLSHQSGLGLGLAIARRIVDMHGGRIWAESKGVDSGSTFYVRLPMAALAAAPAGVRDLTGTQDADQTGHLKILLIEDSEDILFLLRIELETAGHMVITAADGTQGFTLTRTHRPDLIISDIKMPGLNGYELIREIRASPDLREIPAIALTGFGAKADFDRALAAGFDACISKPAEPYEISALIKKLTEREAQSKPEGD